MRRVTTLRAVAVAVAVTTAALLGATSCAAFSVRNAPITPMGSADSNRVLAQRFTVGQPLMGSILQHEALQTLKIAIPGRVFVSFNEPLTGDAASAPPSGAWQTTAATVRFSGNSEQVFDFFEVVSPSTGVVEVRRRPDVRGVLHDAFLLTEISLAQSHAVTQLVSSGSAEVVIEDMVLAGSAPGAVHLQLSGSGDVYVHAKSPSFATSIKVDTSGSGDLYWAAGVLQPQSFAVRLSGSGDVTLVGETLETTALEVDIAGSGDVCVEASSIETNSLSTSTLGSGEISFSAAAAHCAHEDISILGSGDVYTGAIQCKDVKVTVAGAGDIYVQAVDSIRGSAYGSGDIKYVGAAPRQISDRYDSSVFSSEQNKKYHAIARHKDTNKATPCALPPVPAREAVHVKSSFWAGSVGSASAILGPLVFFAILACCYLRSQTGRRRGRHGRHQREQQAPPRYGSVYQPHLNQEMQPLQPPPQPQTQVYV